MRQDFPDRPWVGDEADQPAIAITVGTRQRKRPIHPCQWLRPGNFCRVFAEKPIISIRSLLFYAFLRTKNLTYEAQRHR